MRIALHLRMLATALLLCASVAQAGEAVDRRTQMQRLADHWREVQLADGSLPYGYDFLADRPAEPNHSPWFWVVRQAGALYMLVEYARTSGDARLREPSRRAMEALKAHSLPLGKSTAQQWVEATHVESLPFGRWKLQMALDRLGLLYQTSGPGKVVSSDERYEHAHTGATAMALLAALAYERATADERYVDLRRAWLRALLDLRQPGRGFRAMPTSIDTSDFYDGEAWLALAVYADVHRDDAEVARALADLDAAMIERYGAATSFGFHHWGSMAAAQRLATTGDPRFLAFLRRQTELYFERLARKLDPADNGCPDVEGVASALGALDRAGERDSPLARKTRDWIARQAKIIEQLQIRPGETSRQLAGGASLQAPRMADYAGTFLLGLYDFRVRVDMDMHCLSALAILEREGVLQRAGE